jgi:hypothetical protein
MFVPRALPAISFDLRRPLQPGEINEKVRDLQNGIELVGDESNVTVTWENNKIITFHAEATYVYKASPHKHIYALSSFLLPLMTAQEAANEARKYAGMMGMSDKDLSRLAQWEKTASTNPFGTGKFVMNSEDGFPDRTIELSHTFGEHPLWRIELAFSWPADVLNKAALSKDRSE